MKFIFLTIILATGLFISTQSNEKPDDIPSLTHPFSEEYDTYEDFMNNEYDTFKRASKTGWIARLRRDCKWDNNSTDSNINTEKTKEEKETKKVETKEYEIITLF
jgi:hypothetical protein